jgi:hypothetical protein
MSRSKCTLKLQSSEGQKEGRARRGKEKTRTMNKFDVGDSASTRSHLEFAISKPRLPPKVRCQFLSRPTAKRVDLNQFDHENVCMRGLFGCRI